MLFQKTLPEEKIPVGKKDYYKEGVKADGYYQRRENSDLHTSCRNINLF
jgi:hypothetical protein